MGDERPTVATKRPPVRIPSAPLSPTDSAANDAVMATIGEEHTVVELLQAADELAYSTVMTLGSVVLKLERRRQDVEELLSIAKSGQELSRKVKRLAERLGVDEARHVQ